MVSSMSRDFRTLLAAATTTTTTSEGAVRSDPHLALTKKGKAAGVSREEQYSLPGLCGLHNLGNTCYMNSALQCLAHSPLLSPYFLSGRFQQHLNKRNVLGTGGVLTQEFVGLLKNLRTHSQIDGFDVYAPPPDEDEPMAVGTSQDTGRSNNSAITSLSPRNNAVGQQLIKRKKTKNSCIGPVSFKVSLNFHMGLYLFIYIYILVFSYFVFKFLKMFHM
jgi:hypothetical protein